MEQKSGLSWETASQADQQKKKMEFRRRKFAWMEAFFTSIHGKCSYCLIYIHFSVPLPLIPQMHTYGDMLANWSCDYILTEQGGKPCEPYFYGEHVIAVYQPLDAK